MSIGSAAPSGVPVSVLRPVPRALSRWAGLGLSLAGNGSASGQQVSQRAPRACPQLTAPLPIPCRTRCLWPPAEPHEICDEDNFGTVVWKETPAGEVAAVRCPRNATGEVWGEGRWHGLLSHPHREAPRHPPGPAPKSGQLMLLKPRQHGRDPRGQPLTVSEHSPRASICTEPIAWDVQL